MKIPTSTLARKKFGLVPALLLFVTALSAVQPMTVQASSWGPTLLVNTESFMTIDDTDSTNIELRFGDSVNEILRWDVTDNQFVLTDDLEILGSLSGVTLHAQDNLTSSGGLTVGSEARFNDNVDVEGILSGAIIKAATSLTSSGTLVWEGAASGASLYVADGFFGSGLVDCDAAGDTLNWDTTTQRFSCGTDANDGALSAGQGLTIASSAVSLTAAHSGTTITATVLLSGAVVHAQNLLTTSGGTLIVEGAEGADADLILDADDGDDATDTWTLRSKDSGNDLTFLNDTTEVFNLTTVGALQIDSNLTIGSAADVDYTLTFDADTADGVIQWMVDEDAFYIQDDVGIGTNDAQTALEVVGTISGAQIHGQDSVTSSGTLVWEGAASGATLYVANGFFGSGLVDCDAAGDTLNWDTTTQRFSCGTDANDGALSAGQGLTIASSAVSLTAAHSGTTITAVTLLSGALVHAQNNLTSSGGLSVGSAARFSSSVDVVGVLSGVTVHAQDNLTSSGGLTIGGEARFNGNVDVEGIFSGAILKAATSLASSGSLSVDGAVTFGNITSCTLLETNSEGVLACAASTFDESVDDRVNTLLQAGSGIGLSYDDANNTLTIKTTSTSGADIFLSPEYPHSIYFSSGSATVGQLSLSGSISDGDNYYHWSSTKNTIQDYWISTRVRIPDNFSRWEAADPIELRYRTGSGLAVTNHVTLRLLDTAGSDVPLTGGSALASTGWNLAIITGPESSGTYTPGSGITLLLKLAGMTPAHTADRGYARAGYINLNWLMK